MGSSVRNMARAVVGRPLRSDRLEETLLPKRLALPGFCSEPLSSVAYATEQIGLVLGLGGLALLHLTAWVAAAVVVLLVVVVASYRQTCAAYPNGGGAYGVSRANLGEDAALVAASSLLIDYVLTVKESGRAFAIPTYGFVLAIYAMLLVGFAKVAFGDGITASSAHYELRQVAHTGGLFTVFLVLRAFASGCTALTGVEAVSNGVPGFEPPKSRNAATTLLMMGLLATTMFAGITALALLAH